MATDPESVQEITLYKSLSLFLADPGEVQDPIGHVRSRLKKYIEVLAARLEENPEKWGIYVERHRGAGIRMIVQDEAGKEVDLDKLPADVKDLDTWLT